MTAYESVFILQSDLDEETKDSILEKVKEVISKNGGELIQLDGWGKKKLAYTINKTYKEGDYYQVNFYGNQDVLSELDRFYKMNDEVIRSLTVKQEA